MFKDFFTLVFPILLNAPIYPLFGLVFIYEETIFLFSEKKLLLLKSSVQKIMKNDILGGFLHLASSTQIIKLLSFDWLT